MRRIFFVSDDHFRHGPTLPETVGHHAWILDDIRARVRAGVGPDVIVIGGDLADTGLTAEALLAICGFVQPAAEIAEVVIAYGNHDRRRELDVLARLSAKHPITVYATPTAHRIPGCVFAVLPWVERVIPIKDLAGYSAAEEKVAEVKRLEEILDALRAEADALTQPGDALVGIGHLMLAESLGALGKPGQPDSKGEFLVSLAQLARLGCQAYLLGHVHDGRAWMVPGRAATDALAPVSYNGATRSWGWGEVARKRYTIVEVTEDPTVPARVEYVGVPGRAMIEFVDAWVAGPGIDDPWRWAHWTGAPEELEDGEAVGNDFRFVYDVPAGRAAEARAAAALVEKALRSEGAHDVKLAPRVQPEGRPRRPEMAAALTLEAKLDVFVKSRNGDVEEDRVVRARRHLRALQIEAGNAGRLAAGGMRVGWIELSQMPGYPDPVRFDIEGLPGRFIALVGENGAGKSVLLSCWGGAMYRSTKDTDLRWLAQGEGVVKTGVWANDEWWTLEHQFARSKSFQYPSDLTKERPNCEGKLGQFQTWADDNLLPEDVFHNSIFAGQGASGLLALRPSERRDPLLKALGLGPLKKLYALALLKAKEATKLAGQARGARDAAKARVVALPNDPLVIAVDAARARAVTLDAEAARLDADERAARSAGSVYRAAKEADDAVRAALNAERSRSADALTTLEKQLAEHREILARAVAIRAAVIECRALREEISTLSREHGEHDRAADEAYAAWNVADKAAHAACKKRQVNADVAEYVARVEANAALLPARRADVAAAEAALTGAIEALDAARVASASKLSGRVDGLLGGLHEVLGTTEIEGAHGVARASVGADAAAVAAPGALAPLESAVQAARAALARAKGERDAIEPTATRLEAVISRRAAHLEAAIEEDAAITSGKIHDAARAAALALREGVSAKLAAARAALVAPMVLDNQAGALARAEASADTLAAPIADRRSDLARIDQRIADLPSPPIAPAGPAADVLLAGMKLARSDAQAARDFVKDYEAAVMARRVAEDALAAADEALVDPDAEDAAWELLVAFLGPKGLQSIEIDVACPELTAILRDLLGCFGSRWSMSCEATRPNADGSGEVDSITFPTIDNDSTIIVPRDASCFSGGQRVPLSFAIRLAVAMLVSLRTATTSPTLILDEPTAALHDAADFEGAMAMIRRAAAMIGAGKVIIVSHSKVFVELCDIAVVVKDGTLTTISPATIPEK